MGLLAAGSADGASTIPDIGLVPVLALLAASVLLLGVVGLGAIALFRRRGKPRRPSIDHPELPDPWVEAGRRLKE